MSGLDALTTGSPAVANAASQQTLPDWYNQYIQGIASKATGIAANPYQAYPGAQVADFNDDQTNAFQAVRSNQGAFKPELGAAVSTVNSAAPAAAGALSSAGALASSAPGAVAGPAAQWTDPGVAAKYMSPYTSSVVDEIGRLGNQNLNENLIPQVQSQFVGSGQFGSQRGDDAIGHTIRDAQTNISGLQSQALQAGYTGAENTFGADANREQQQQGLQATTATNAGNTLNTSGLYSGITGTQLGTTQGALGQMAQTLGNNDATSLGAIGGQQQALTQTGDTAAYNNFLTQQNWDWNQLGKVQGAVQGAQLPTGQTATSTNNPSQPSALGALGTLAGLYSTIQQPSSTTNP